jgi:hypothetical protein
MIRKRGVKARKGMVRLIGETFNAFVYRIIAVISSGSAHKVASQNVLSKDGNSINNRLPARTGRANRSLAQAIKYSSLEVSARLVKASLVARKRAVRRE